MVIEPLVKNTRNSYNCRSFIRDGKKYYYYPLSNDPEIWKNYQDYLNLQKLPRAVNLYNKHVVNVNVQKLSLECIHIMNAITYDLYRRIAYYLYQEKEYNIYFERIHLPKYIYDRYREEGTI